MKKERQYPEFTEQIWDRLYLDTRMHVDLGMNDFDLLLWPLSRIAWSEVMVQVMGELYDK